MGYIFDKYLALKPEFTRKYLMRAYKAYMYDRTLSIFKYEGLPETIPEEMFEYYLQHYGSCVVAEVKGNLYALHGNFGGYIDPYYRPSLYVVANPALEYSADLKLGEDCVFCVNDKLWVGMEPLIARYAYLIAENLITIRTANIMLRIVALLSAPDDKTKAEAELYLKNLVDGKIGVIGENSFLDGINMQSPPSNNGSYLTQFIELHQYLLGTFYSEIGLKANFNMKREAIMAEESSLNDDVIVSLVETMFNSRLSNVARINELYGTSISVKFNGEWKRNEIERSIELVAAATSNNIPLDAIVSHQTSTEVSNDSEDGADDADVTDEADVTDVESRGEEGSSRVDTEDEEKEVAEEAEDAEESEETEETKETALSADGLNANVVNLDADINPDEILDKIIEAASEQKEEDEKKQEEMMEQNALDAKQEGGEDDAGPDEKEGTED